MSCLSAPLTNAVFAYLCICVFVFVYLQVRHPGTLFLRSLYHHLSENIWFVWSKTSYSGDKRRCYQAGQTNERRQQWKIGLLSLWAVGRLSFAISTSLISQWGGFLPTGLVWLSCRATACKSWFIKLETFVMYWKYGQLLWLLEMCTSSVLISLTNMNIFT